MKIGIACDHHGIDVKYRLVSFLKSKGYEVIDYGANNEEAKDYPIYAFKVGEAIRNKDIDFGILMCGTGIGMSIAANKVPGVRCARICDFKDARLSQEHNGANIISFSANIRFSKIKKMVIIAITSPKLVEERHIRRVNMIDEYHV